MNPSPSDSIRARIDLLLGAERVVEHGLPERAHLELLAALADHERPVRLPHPVELAEGEAAFDLRQGLLEQRAPGETGARDERDVDPVLLCCHPSSPLSRPAPARAMVPLPSRVRSGRKYARGDDDLDSDARGRPQRDSRARRDLRSALMVWRRDLVRLRRNSVRIVFGLAQPIGFLIVFSIGVAAVVSNQALPEQVSYKVFIFPGVLAMTIISSALIACVSIVWDREFGFMREMLVAPVSRVSLIAGKTLGGSSIAMLQGLIILRARAAGRHRPQRRSPGRHCSSACWR